MIRALIIAAAAALVLASAAQAKGMARVVACGASGCTTTASTAHHPCRGCFIEQLLQPAPGSARPPAAAPFFRITLELGPPDRSPSIRERLLFVPSRRRAARSAGPGRGWSWFAVSGGGLRAARQTVTGLQPYRSACMPLRRDRRCPPPPPRASSSPRAGDSLAPLLAGSAGALALGSMLASSCVARRRRRISIDPSRAGP